MGRAGAKTFADLKSFERTEGLFIKNAVNLADETAFLNACCTSRVEGCAT